LKRLKNNESGIQTVPLKSDISYDNKPNFRVSRHDKMNKFMAAFFDSIQVIVIALAFVVLIYIFVASFNIVDGESMLPNFEPRDLIISEKITTNFGTLKRGDVIIFSSTIGKDLIKRIIGLPGDKLKITDGKVYVNGIALNEYYLTDYNKYVQPETYFEGGKELTVPDNQYIVMGDNRTNSLDSRRIGPVEKSTIKGKAWVIFWPANRIHFVDHVRYAELGDK